jgi:hypothetical protein
VTITLATTAALKAVAAADREQGLYLTVEGLGWYEFRASSSTTENLPWVVAPDAGSGRWHLMTNPPGRIAMPAATLGDAATVAVDAGPTSTFTLQMGASLATRAIGNPSNGLNAQEVRIWLRQPASPPTGGCKITLGSDWELFIGTLDINPEPNKVSLLQGQFIFGKWRCQVGGG